MKTSELQGAALDWAVAKCAGELDEQDYYLHESTGAFMLERGEVSWVYSPSTNWSQGGPIIEREISCLTDRQDDTMPTAWSKSGKPGVMGPTKLIAAMRCYVASKLGDEVEIPEELK